MKKIALLFLTRKELNHPRVWQQMLEGKEDLFNLYFHSKEPIDDLFFKPYQVPHPVPTSYLVHGRAWQVLLQEALKKEENVKFIYLSESCMPLYPLEDIYHHLIQNTNSYMRYTSTWWPKESEREIIELPPEHRLGNAEWIILNRKHANLIAEDQTVLPLASKRPNSDHEGYPSSLFSLRGCLDEIVYRITTYANFDSPIEPLPYHFHSYDSLERNYLYRAKREGCLFARKLTPAFPAEKLKIIAEERLMRAPSEVLGPSSFLTSQLEEKITLLQTREELSLANSCALLPMLLNEGFYKVGYVIGVGVGLHIERLLQLAYIENLYGVDDYRRQNYHGITLDSGEEEKLYAYVQKRMEYLDLKVEIIKKSALEVVENVPDQTIDMLWIHEEHSLIPIDVHLNTWFPKLKQGAILAGCQKSAFYPHLQPEIQQFFFEKKMKVNQEYVEPYFWWVEINQA